MEALEYKNDMFVKGYIVAISFFVVLLMLYLIFPEDGQYEYGLILVLLLPIIFVTVIFLYSIPNFVIVSENDITLIRFLFKSVRLSFESINSIEIKTGNIMLRSVEIHIGDKIIGFPSDVTLSENILSNYKRWLSIHDKTTP